MIASIVLLMIYVDKNNILSETRERNEENEKTVRGPQGPPGGASARLSGQRAAAGHAAAQVLRRGGHRRLGERAGHGRRLGEP